MPALIREFEPGDEEPFRRLNEEWIRAYFSLEPKDLEVLGNPRGYILDRGGFVIMATDEGEPVGCCALLPMGDGGFELGKMAVTPAAQGRGIARKLLQACLEKARSRGATRLYLETNSKLLPALRLYESCGFTPVAAETAPPSPYSRSNLRMELLLADTPGQPGGASRRAP
jgi:GNAT superfamily N-acetyltransferase